MRTQDEMEFFFKALRIAEKAHRTRNKGAQSRKAPKGEDRPAYIIHPVEVAMLLQNAGGSTELVAAGLLHDTIEDTDLTAPSLLQAIEVPRVVDLVLAVTELDKGQSWELRNGDYLERIQNADIEAQTLSCADKLCNIRDMCSYLDKGFKMEDFTSRDLTTQVTKFRALRTVYRKRVPEVILAGFTHWLKQLENHLHP